MFIERILGGPLKQENHLQKRVYQVHFGAADSARRELKREKLGAAKKFFLNVFIVYYFK